jgi:uncharacterized protein YndB with AHSA1/START domain
MRANTDVNAVPREHVLDFVRTFDAPVALVFKLWSSPEMVMRWWGPKGFRMSECKLDFRVGGTWNYCMVSPEDGSDHRSHGTYREIITNKKIEFTYWHMVLGYENLVTIILTEKDGKTEMHFRQAPFREQEHRDGHNWGWNSTFDILEEYIDSNQGKIK